MKGYFGSCTGRPFVGLWDMDWFGLRINMGSWVKISDLVISMETDRYLGSKYGYG